MQKQIKIHDYIKSLPKLEKELDGKAMCAMKWIHQYVNFELNAIKMCHNVPHRYITDEEIDRLGKSIFLNNPYEEERRQEKLNNIKHSDCSSCWDSESKGVRSCRLPQPFYDMHRTRFGGSDNETMPTQLELVFGNLCDLKCIYCNPGSSSQWESENIKYDSTYRPIQKVNSQKLTNVFWEWLEEGAVEEILQYYIMGGEPLLQPQFYEFLERLIPLLKNKPNRFNIKPELIVLTNGNTPEKYLKKWIDIIPSLSKVMTIQMDISVEGYQQKAEYIRSNLVWDTFSRNVDTIFSNSKDLDISIRFSITHSVMSITSILDLLKWIKDLKDKHNIEADLIRTSIVKPSYLSPWLLTKDFKIYIDNTCSWINEFAPEWGIYIDYLKSIGDSFENHSQDDIRNFINFEKRMRLRRNLNLEEIFPEMKNWLETCKKYED